MQCVLVLANGASWESAALGALQRSRDFVVLKRCVDIADLMASATTGQADHAVVALDTPGLDRIATEHVRRFRVRLVGVNAASAGREGDSIHEVAQWATRLGFASVVGVGEVDRLPTVLAADDTSAHLDAEPPAHIEHSVDPGTSAGAGRVIAVWGPAGAPGRTTVAIGLTAALARRRLRTVLLDADPWGGSVAQQLGVLDEVSGLLAAARLHGTGSLSERFGGVCRGLEEFAGVVTGLPRPDRWQEVRPGVIEEVLCLARGVGTVVVDTGFSLEQDGTVELSGRSGRNTMTIEAVANADVVVVVAHPDPVGLTRLANGLTELDEISPGSPRIVVLNRMRQTLGWSAGEVVAMTKGLIGPSVRAVLVLPEDRRAVDAAVAGGRFVADGPLVKALANVADALVPESAAGAGRTLRRRTAGRAHQR